MLLDAQGDLLRGLQVVESASGIPTALLGDHIEGTYTNTGSTIQPRTHIVLVSKDMDTSVRRLPLGVCAR